ncbi:hypothetical protein GQX74_011481 [Glossina fuscipes]|nr:hypothetical protein GQX74_011481 [Glossina fuscipes]
MSWRYANALYEVLVQCAIISLFGAKLSYLHQQRYYREHRDLEKLNKFALSENKVTVLLKCVGQRKMLSIHCFPSRRDDHCMKNDHNTRKDIIILENSVKKYSCTREFVLVYCLSLSSVKWANG